MKERPRKPLLTPGKGLIDTAQRREVEQRTPKPQVGGSIPSGPAKPYVARVFTDSTVPEAIEKAPAHPLF